MPKVSENELSELTGKTRATVRRRLVDVPSEEGKHRARLYDSKVALEAIYIGIGGSEGEQITASEAQRQLTIARKAEIDLNMEVIRRDRIPIEIVESVNDDVFGNVAGLLKASEGKTMTEEAIRDIMTELRSIPQKLKW